MSWLDKKPKMGRHSKCRPNPSNEIGYQIVHLEKGSSLPSLSSLDRFAGGLDVRIDLHVVLGLKFPQGQALVDGGKMVQVGKVMI
jgi:hypothetical protein